MAGIDVSGLAQLRGAISSAVKGVTGQSEWWVGSVVVYAPVHEFGSTVKGIRPRPYFRPAVRIVASRAPKFAGGLERILRGQPFDLTGQIAFELERETKNQIRVRRLIDTGNLRASFASAPTLPQVAARSSAQADPGTVA